MLPVIQLEQRELQESMPVNGRHCLMLLPFTPLQALLLLGTFVYFEMSRVPPDGSSFVGYICTNKDCSRLFCTRGALVRHKNHSSHRKTLCSNMKYAEAMYAINDNRASSLQSSRIVTYPLSGNCRVLYQFTHVTSIYAQFTHVNSIYAHKKLQLVCVNPG